MELVLTREDLESLPEPRVFEKQLKPAGLLNSNFKSIAKHNLSNPNSQSIFGIRQRIKSSQYQFTSSIATVLKVSVFATIILTIFS